MRRALLLVVLCSCGPTALSASSYDQRCSAAADCVAVAEGPYCGVCGPCPNAAINVSAKAKFDADLRGLHCPPRLDGPAACGACNLPLATCTAGKCAAVTGG